MSRKRQTEEAAPAAVAPPPPLSLGEALGVPLSLDQGWTPIVDFNGAVIGATADDGSKAHLRGGTVVLEVAR